MALLNRPVEHNSLYDAQGRLQGGLSALEDLANVIAMGAGSDGGEDAMDQEDEMEPAQELPVSDPSHVAVDSDEDMSSSEDDEPSSSDDEAMEEIAIDEEPAPAPTEASSAAGMSDEPVTLSPPDAIMAPSPPLASPLQRTGSSGRVSPNGRSASRPRSLRSRSSRRALRRSSLNAEGDLPPGEKLKQKFLSANVLSTMLVSHLTERRCDDVYTFP
jgi:serine/threonine-protein phosphatase 6 regulatory subunit 3